MIGLLKTPEFDRWLFRLRDEQAKVRIGARLYSLSNGHAGDHKSVGQGVYELRIHSGPGYRVYYTYRGSMLVIILAGGDKHSQDKDIRLAHRLAKTF